MFKRSEYVPWSNLSVKILEKRANLLRKSFILQKIFQIFGEHSLNQSSMIKAENFENFTDEWYFFRNKFAPFSQYYQYLI